MSSNIGSGSGVRFSGLGSGIDTEALVNALMAYERLPINRIEDDKKKVTSKQKVVQEINGLVTALRDKAAALYAPNALRGTSATSADDKVVKATGGSGAAPGTYNVTVTALAQTHTLATGVGPALTDGTTLDITVGGVTKGVAVQAGDTLQTFADRINGTADAGATASVVNNRLVLISKTGGTEGEITLGGSAAAGLGFAQTQQALDSAATVNGVPVSGSGNRLEGVITGMTLDLTGLGTTTVTVAADNSAIQGQVEGFVTAYNNLIRNVNNATKYDAATKTAGTLQGDSSMTSFAGRLRGIAGAAVSGLGGTYDSLAQIGITGSRTGELTFDAATFQEAIAKDPEAVRKVFGNDDGVAGVAATDGIARQIQEFTNSFSTETLASRITGFGTTLQRMTDKIDQLEDVMAIREQRLRTQFQAMETAISRLNSQSSGVLAQMGAL